MEPERASRVQVRAGGFRIAKQCARAIAGERGCAQGFPVVSKRVVGMSYQAEISRASPTAILMVMDQSTSMSHRLLSGQSKAAFLADVLNKTLYTIITNCSKADGVRDYFHVGVI